MGQNIQLKLRDSLIDFFSTYFLLDRVFSFSYTLPIKKQACIIGNVVYNICPLVFLNGKIFQ
jgi:hypothetical protein